MPYKIEEIVKEPSLSEESEEYEALCLELAGRSQSALRVRERQALLGLAVAALKYQLEVEQQ